MIKIDIKHCNHTCIPNYFYLSMFIFPIVPAPPANGTGETFAEKQARLEAEEEAKKKAASEFLIPKLLKLANTPSVLTNETVPFPIQVLYSLTLILYVWPQESKNIWRI